MEDWSQIIRALGAGAGVLGGAVQSFRKEPLPYGVQEAAQATNNANTYLAASADPNSAYFQNIAGTEEQRGRTDLIASIDRIMREMASRKAGGRGTINPERRDESIWGILAKGFQEAGLKARETARTQLVNMAGGQQRNAASYSALVQPSMLNSLFNRENQTRGIATATTGIERFGEMLNKPKQGTTAFGQASVPDWYKDSSFGLQY